jgi:methylenetetrahydrofolate reductase (NADPH)
MRIIDILKNDNITLSFEVFTPKKIENFESVQEATEGVAALRPSFM